jgi:hypothetical protein
MRILILSAAALIAACSSGRGAECQGKLRLWIDDLFSAGERNEIILALGDWNKASGNRLCLDYELYNTATDKETFRGDGKFTVYCPHGPWQVSAAMALEGNPCGTGDCLGITVREPGDGSSDIFIFAEGMASLRSIAGHELGHVFGLGHNDNYESIMYQTVRTGKGVGAIDAKNIGCLLDAHAFLKPINNCTFTR